MLIYTDSSNQEIAFHTFAVLGRFSLPHVECGLSRVDFGIIHIAGIVARRNTNLEPPPNVVTSIGG